MKDKTNHMPLLKGFIGKSFFNSSFPSLMLLAISLSLLCASNCQYSGPKNQYKNCSTYGSCTNCWNEFICLDCSNQYQFPCCPKYCTGCHSNQQCFQCQTGFTIKMIPGRNWTICAYYNRVDYNRDHSDQLKCVKGYFLQTYTNFCEKCPLNCQSCFDSVNCQKCYQGYQFKNGDCLKQEDQSEQEKIVDNQTSVVIAKQCASFQEIFDPAFASGLVIGSCCLSCCKNVRNKFKKKKSALNDQATLEFNEQIQSSKDQKEIKQSNEFKHQDQKSSKEIIQKELTK